VWDAETLKPIHDIERDRSWSFSRGPEPFCRPVLSDDWRRLAASFDKKVVIWDVDDGKPLSDPIDCGETVTFLNFPNGSSNELRAHLQNGAEVVWKFTDVPGKW